MLTLYAPSGAARAAAIVYGAGLCALFAASGLYHRWRWNPRWRPLLRRIDHSTIYIFIAASYTPVALLVLSGTIQVVVLVSIWAGALGGVALSVAWITAPRVLVAASYVALGWVALVSVPQMADRLGVAPIVLFAAGGADLLDRRRRLRAAPPEPVAAHVRVPRDLPRARHPRRRHALRGDRRLGHPRGLSATPAKSTAAGDESGSTPRPGPARAGTPHPLLDAQLNPSAPRGGATPTPRSLGITAVTRPRLRILDGVMLPPETTTAELELPTFDPRALARRAALPLAAAAVAVAVLVLAGGPLHAFTDALRRALEADPRWVLAAVGFEIVSFSGYIGLLWLVGERATPRMNLRASAQVTLAGAAVTRLLPTGGAGGVALTLWALRRTGLESREATRTLLTFLVLLYAVFLGAIAVAGGLIAVGLGGAEGGHIALAAGASIGATAAIGLAVAAAMSAAARGRPDRPRRGLARPRRA